MNTKKLIQEHNIKNEDFTQDSSPNRDGEFWAKTKYDCKISYYTNMWLNKKKFKKILKLVLTKILTYGIIITVVRKYIKCRCSSMVEFQPSKLAMRVRFPLPAPICTSPRIKSWWCFFDRIIMTKRAQLRYAVVLLRGQSLVYFVISFSAIYISVKRRLLRSQTTNLLSCRRWMPIPVSFCNI